MNTSIISIHHVTTLITAITISDEENEKYQFCPILQGLRDDHHFMGEYSYYYSCDVAANK